MKRCLSHVTGLILALFILTEAAESVGPDFANYRGRLVDASGAPLTGSFDIVFKLYGQSLTDAAEAVYRLNVHDIAVGDLSGDGTPDLIVSLPEPFLLDDDIEDPELAVPMFHQP
ncbi:MAG: hypothetical protein IH914_10135, partial [candidate division Zixibacteria bacterium]|nr:hypothetical protein [candidate division Zixibacteria bacterium]